MTPKPSHPARAGVRVMAAAAVLALLLAQPAGAQIGGSKKRSRPNATEAPSISLRNLDPLAPTPPPPPLPISEADWRTPNPDDLLVIDTNRGRVIVELTPVVAPKSVERIKALTRQHFYDGLTFFRVLDSFMAQTGDPKNTGEGGSPLPNVEGEFTFRRARATRFVTVAEPAGAAVGFIGALPVMSQPDVVMAMTNDGKAAAWPLFCPGVAGMARDASPDSANSQFFLMRDAYPSLEKRYTGFGRVIVGQDVVKAIKAGEPVAAPQDKMIQVRLASDLPPGERPKVRVLTPDGAAFKIMVDRARNEEGADFSVCDLSIPSQVR